VWSLGRDLIVVWPFMGIHKPAIETPRDSPQKSDQQVRKLTGIQDLQMRDIRRTVATGLGRLKVSPVTISRVLDHTLQGVGLSPAIRRLTLGVPENRLFHIMRNRAESGTGKGEPLALLQSRLPPSWRVLGKPFASTLTLRAPDGSTARLPVLRRKSLDPRDVVILGRSPQETLAGTLVTAPFLSRRTRELLTQAGASYADASGNLRIVLDKPGLYVETEGAQKDPRRERRPLVSLKGPAAARVVRALCDVRPPYGVRRLAEIAKTAPSSVTRVVGLLEKEALVTRRSRDQITEVDWAGLIQRWAQDYQVLSSNEAVTLLAPRGLAALTDGLRAFKGRIAVTGSLAAALRAPVAPARIAMLYVDDPSRAAKSLGLRPAEAGANVMLLRPLDDVAFARTWVEEGVTHAALSQVAVDLLTAPGRAPSEGEELLGWMKKNPNAWRT
jgi:hypothetical protein